MQEFVPVTASMIRVGESAVKVAVSIQEFMQELSELAELHRKKGGHLLLRTAQLKFHHTLRKLSGSSSLSVALQEEGLPVEIIDDAHLKIAYLQKRRELSEEEKLAVLKEQVISLTVQKAPPEFIKNFVRTYFIEHRLPLKTKHLLAGETLQDLSDKGYRVEGDQALDTAHKLDDVGKWPGSPEISG